MKAAWRLGMVETEDYLRAVDLRPVPGRACPPVVMSTRRSSRWWLRPGRPHPSPRPSTWWSCRRGGGRRSHRGVSTRRTPKRRPRRGGDRPDLPLGNPALRDCRPPRRRRRVRKPDSAGGRPALRELPRPGPLERYEPFARPPTFSSRHLGDGRPSSRPRVLGHLRLVPCASQSVVCRGQGRQRSAAPSPRAASWTRRSRVPASYGFRPVRSRAMGSRHHGT
jgi:hypothetical protein